MHKREYLDFIDVNHIVASLRKNCLFLTKEETQIYVENSLNKGVLFKNKLVKIVFQTQFSNFLRDNITRYYFICPICEKRASKLYSSLDGRKIGCRRCLKSSLKKSLSKAARAISIQADLYDLVNINDLTAKKKRKLKNSIVNNYNHLESYYKFTYNFLIFREVQNWCLRMLTNDQNKSAEYKKAVHDMLTILKNINGIIAIKKGKK